MNYRFKKGNSVDKSNTELFFNMKNKLKPLANRVNCIKMNAVKTKEVEFTNKGDSSITKL